jgi:hypothetical protein
VDPAEPSGAEAEISMEVLVNVSCDAIVLMLSGGLSRKGDRTVFV